MTSDRRAAIARGQQTGGHLVEQRLEQVVVHPIHHRHLHIRLSQPLRGCEAREAASDDYDAAAPDTVVVAHWPNSPSRSATMIRAAASISARCENA